MREGAAWKGGERIQDGEEGRVGVTTGWGGGRNIRGREKEQGREEEGRWVQKREGVQTQSPTPTHLQVLRGWREWGKLGVQAAPDQTVLEAPLKERSLLSQGLPPLHCRDL